MKERALMNGTVQNEIVFASKYLEAEKLLRDFANAHLAGDDLRTWQAQLQPLVASRLENTINNTYFQSISMSVNALRKPENMNHEKITVLSALLLYDFAHRAEIPDTEKRYNKTVFTRFLLNHRTDRNQFGKTAKECVDRMTLDEISRHLLDTKTNIQNADRQKDLVLLSDIALERQQTKTHQAQLISDTVVKSFIKQWGSGFNEFDTVDNLLRYSAQSRDYIFKRLYEENHPYIASFFTLYEKYKAQTPSQEDSVYKKQTIKGIKTLFTQSAYIQKIYDEIKQRVANKAKEVTLATQREEEIKKEEALSIWQSKNAQFYIRILPDLQGRSFEINTVEDDSKGITSIIEDNTMMTHQESTLFYDHKKMSRPLSFNNIYADIVFLVSDESLISTEQKEQLNRLFYNNQERLLQESEKTYLTKTVPLACENLRKRYIFSPQVDFREISFRLNQFQELHNGVQKQKDSLDDTNDSYAYAINQVAQTLQEIKPTIEKTYETAQKRIDAENKTQKQKEEAERIKHEKTRQKEEKKQKEKELLENIYELKKDHLFEEIKHGIEYLKKLYELHTGLHLHDVDVEALDEDGATIGSVSVGPSQGLRLTQRQELSLAQRLEFRSTRDLIELEMGENMEKIIQRFLMIDWVGPHEIAHLIDWASGHFTDRILDSNIAQNRIDDLMTTFSPQQQSLAKKMIALSIKESFIDGIGFYCGMTYGTSNITHDNDQSKRVKDLTTAFCATMEIVENIIRKEPQDKESQSSYQMILLRFMATAQHLTKTAQTNNLIESLATLSIAKNTLADCFYQLNKNTPFISEEQKAKLIDLLYEWFDVGKNFLQK